MLLRILAEMIRRGYKLELDVTFELTLSPAER